MDPESTFRENLELIETTARKVGFRYALSPDEVEDFVSVVNIKLMEDDYRRLRSFRRRSSLATYLATVTVNLLLDYRIEKWGKWRPSAKARRLGVTAVRLETLIVRDRRPVREAIEHLKSNVGVEETRKELERLAGELPDRPGRHVESMDNLDSLSGSAGRPDDMVDDGERALLRRLCRAVTAALDRLAPEERLLIKLKYRDGLMISVIARRLGLDPKPLYRRFERIRRSLRADLEACGIDAEQVARVLDWKGFDLELTFSAPPPGKSDASPSK